MVGGSLANLPGSPLICYREETQHNTKGFSGAKFRGYTIGDGGRQQAERDFNEQHELTRVTNGAHTGNDNDTIRRRNEVLEDRQGETEDDGMVSVGQSGPAAQMSQDVLDVRQSEKGQQQESRAVAQERPYGNTPRPHDVRYPALPIPQHTGTLKDERRLNEGPQTIDLENEEASTSRPSASSAPDYIDLDSSDYGSDYSASTYYPILSPPPAPPPPATEPKLCKEQADLVRLILGGANVFYTGSAGCGKSTVLRSFVGQLKKMKKTVKIVAPTGRSALDISGTTFWTYAGWHPDSMKLPLGKLENNAKYHKHVRERLCETDVLVIDEISMFENQHFERLNRIMKAARSHGEKADAVQARANFNAPFGGVQVVVTGDFCQLPPVRPYTHCMYCGRTLIVCQGGEVYRCPEHGEFYDIDKWTFRSAAWRECQFQHINLQQIHRQSETEFITILNKFRFGRPLSGEDKDLLLHHPSEIADAVKLFPLVREVREVNDKEFARLRGPTVVFDCLDDYYWNKAHDDLKNYWQRAENGKTLKALDHHRYEASLQLRPKMLVVLLVNLDIERGLVNGSQGVVLGFKPIDPAQLPEQVGEHAGRKKAQIKIFVDRAKVKQWPLVRFHNGVTRLIKAHCAISELGESSPYSLMSRTQVPLLAAWAMTIHKSQGMTLSRVDVNISKVFEKGQAYVALSRATSLQGLNVQALGNCNQGGNEQVMEFLQEKFGKDVIEGMVSGSTDLADLDKN